MLNHTIPPSDFYNLLQVPRDASLNDIKIAYHRTLLRLHPDKRSRPCHHAGVNTPASTTTVSVVDTTGVDPSRLPPGEASFDMGLLKEAYETLSDVGLRAAYDGSLRRDEHARSRGPPRPAQAVSLEEFTAVDVASRTEAEIGSGRAMGMGMGMEADAVRQEWQHECRCGGIYRITQDDLENGMHLVGCESCSEVIWVGYEEVVTEDEEE